AVGPRRARGPFADREVARHVQPPAVEAKRRPAFENAADVRSNRLRTLGTLAGSVVLEHDLVGMKRADPVEGLLVPCFVVRVDQRARIHARKSTSLSEPF